MVALSFVRSGDDMWQARQILTETGAAEHAAGRENRAPGGADHLDEILKVSQGVMVARGDLGLEMPARESADVAEGNHPESAQCGIPVIVATQVLESMRTRAAADARRGQRRGQRRGRRRGCDHAGGRDGGRPVSREDGRDARRHHSRGRTDRIGPARATRLHRMVPDRRRAARASRAGALRSGRHACRSQQCLCDRRHHAAGQRRPRVVGAAAAHADFRGNRNGCRRPAADDLPRCGAAHYRHRQGRRYDRACC